MNAYIVINTIWKVTLRHVLTESLELKCVCENCAFVLNMKDTLHMCAKLLIGYH